MTKLVSKTSQVTGLGITGIFKIDGSAVDESEYSILSGQTDINLIDIIAQQELHTGALKLATFKIDGEPPSNEFLLGESVYFSDESDFRISGDITRKNGNFYETNANIKGVKAYRDYDVITLNLSEDGVYRLNNGEILIVSNDYINLPIIPNSEITRWDSSILNGMYDWQIEAKKRQAYQIVMEDLDNKNIWMDSIYTILDTAPILRLIAFQVISLYEISEKIDKMLFTIRYNSEITSYKPKYKINSVGEIKKSNLFRIKSF